MKPMGWIPEELVRQANIYAHDGLGSPETPTIPKTTVGKMGLRGTKGLNVVADLPRESRGGRRGGGEGRSAGSGGKGKLDVQAERGAPSQGSRNGSGGGFASPYPDTRQGSRGGSANRGGGAGRGGRGAGRGRGGGPDRSDWGTPSFSNAGAGAW